MVEIKSRAELTQEQIDANFAAVVKRGSLDEISFYADFVKNANIQDRFGLHPVQLALVNPSNSEDKYKIMKAVLRAGADVNIPDANGFVPAMEAFKNNYRGIGLLLMGAKGADLSVVDLDENGLMNYAARTGSTSVMRKAMKMRVPYSVNKKGEGALSIAMQENNAPMIEAIIQGIWENRKNPRRLPDFKKALQLTKEIGNKELRRALLCGKEEESSFILSSARDRMLEGKIKYTQTEAEFEARYKRLPKEDKDLIKKTVPDSICGQSIAERLSIALFDQIKAGSAHDVAVLLTVGANPNTQNKHGQTPLLAAIGSSLKGMDVGNYDVVLPESAPYDKVEWLIRYGADVWEERHAQTPFLLALSKNRPGVGALLLSALTPEKRAEMVRKKNEDKDGPLKYAAECGGPGGIKLVLENGGDIDERGGQGKRALYWAVSAGKPDNVMALWQGGFKMDLESDEGREILEMLEKQRHTWEVPNKYNENGERVERSVAETDAIRKGIYKNVLKALHKEYVSEWPVEKHVKKAKKAVDINLSLERKLAALDTEEVAKLEGLMTMSIHPKNKKDLDRRSEVKPVMEEMPETKPVSRKSLWKKIVEYRKEVRAQKRARRAQTQRGVQAGRR